MPALSTSNRIRYSKKGSGAILKETPTFKGGWLFVGIWALVAASIAIPGARSWLMVGAILVLASGASLASWGVWRHGETRRLANESSERKQRESQLRKLSRAVEQSPASIIITDRDGCIEYVNRKFCELTGYTPVEACGHTPRLLKSGEMQPDAYQRLWKAILGGSEWRGEFHNKKKDGQLYWESASISPILDDAGLITHFLAVKEDITERKRSEQALSESEAKFRAICESAQNAIIMMDHEGRISSWNPAAERIFGYNSSEVQGRDLHSLIVPERYRGAFHQAFAGFGRSGSGAAIGRTLELIGLRRDGVEFEAELSLAALQINGRWNAVGTVRDISDRKRLEARLETEHRQLLETSRLAGMAEVATNIIHNLGNVLNSVNVASTCATELLRNSGVGTLSKLADLLHQHESDWSAFATSDPRGKQLPRCVAQLAECLLAERTSVLKELGHLQKNIDHIKDIVITQQAYASVAGIMETIQASDLIRDALRLNANSLDRHEVQVTEDFAPVPPITVDKHKVLSILVNLIRNAKFACDESGRPDKSLTVRIANGNRRVKISVLDNGVGIPPENLVRIFNHGFTTRKNGHGFGLHSGALAARELGGSLAAYSDGSGKGATFTLELPAAENVNPG